MKLTRRKLAAAVLGSAAASSLAQTQPSAGTPEEELKIARDRLRANASALDAVKIAMPVEPAFQFKA
jgi:hypothetical protein